MESYALSFFSVIAALLFMHALAHAQQSENTDTPPGSVSFAFDSLGVFGEASGSRDTVYSEQDVSAGRIFLGGKGRFWGVSSSVRLLVSTEITDTRQDMNLYSAEQSYEWIQVTLGDHYPEYGRLSVAGMRTRGFAVALRPGPFRFEANVGQTHRAVEGDSLAGREGTFRRALYGMRLGYDDGKDIRVMASVAKMRDGLGSIARPNGTLPQENVLGGLEASMRILASLTYKGEIGGSAHTRDLESALIRPEGIPDWVTSFITPHSSTSLQYSMRHELRLSLPDVRLTALYSRVNSEYSSLGATQLLGDWEEVKLDARLSLLRSTMQAGGFLSHRSNNLNDDRYLTTRQFSGGGSLNMSVSRGVYLNTMYSFMLESNDAENPADMKRMLTNALFVQPTIELYGDEVIHHFDVTASIQTTRDFIATNFPSLDFSSLNAGCNYFASFTGLFTVMAGYTLVSNANVLDATRRHITSGRLIWDLFERRLSTSLNATYSVARADIPANEDNQRFDFTLTARYAFSAEEHLQLDLRRSDYVDAIASDFSELIGSIKYIRGI